MELKMSAVTSNEGDLRAEATKDASLRSEEIELEVK